MLPIVFASPGHDRVSAIKIASCVLLTFAASRFPHFWIIRMLPIAIFHPVLALAFLSGIVWTTMLLRRALRMRAAGIKPQEMPTRVLADAKFGDAQLPNNNLMNLFELPVLFYVSSVLIYVLLRVDDAYVWLGWAYVLLRAVHSGIAITYNNVLQRGVAYLLSSMVLWLIWLRLALQIVQA
jgi:hypothetical protein